MCIVFVRRSPLVPVRRTFAGVFVRAPRGSLSSDHRVVDVRSAVSRRRHHSDSESCCHYRIIVARPARPGPAQPLSDADRMAVTDRKRVFPTDGPHTTTVPAPPIGRRVESMLSGCLKVVGYCVGRYSPCCFMFFHSEC